MATIKVTEIENGTVGATDKVYCFSGTESKAPTIADLVGSVPGRCATGTCNTENVSLTKEVTSDNWTAKPGECILVNFRYGGSGDPSDGITLKINDNEELPVYMLNSSGIVLQGSGINSNSSIVFMLNEDGTAFYALSGISEIGDNYIRLEGGFYIPKAGVKEYSDCNACIPFKAGQAYYYVSTYNSYNLPNESSCFLQSFLSTTTTGVPSATVKQIAYEVDSKKVYVRYGKASGNITTYENYTFGEWERIDFDKEYVDRQVLILNSYITNNTSDISTIKGDDVSKSMRQVAEEVVNALPAVYTPKGTVAFADLPALEDCQIGWVYNISDSFITTSDFIEGSGIVKEAGSNIAIIDADGNGTKKYDILSGAVDLSGYQTKELSAPISGYTTVESALNGIIETGSAVVPGNLAGQVPINGSDLGTTNNNIVVTDADGHIKPAGCILGSAAGANTGTAAGNVPVVGTALGTTDNNIVVTNTSGQLKPSGKTPDILYKMANAGAVCSTAIGNAAKTIAITGFTLFTGVTVKVMFTKGNSAASPTLNVNGTGAKAIKVVRAGAKIVPTNKTGYWRGASSTSSEMWQPYTTLELLYDGTDWVIMGNPVVESYYSTSNGYSVYADGKIEQWLLNKTDGTYTLPIAFSSSTSWTVFRGVLSSESATHDWGTRAWGITKTGTATVYFQQRDSDVYATGY